MAKNSIDELLKEETVALTKRGTVRKRKPKESIQYFTSDTEEAILEYLRTKNPAKRNEIFNSRINYAFHKLAENIIHTFKFYYTEVNTIDELKHEVVAFLLEKLHLYKQDKGKAYSYFGTIAKRYLILYNNANYKKLKEKADVEAIDEDKTIFIDLVNEEHNNLPINKFINLFIIHVDKNLWNYFPKEEDARTADAVMELFRKRENLDIFNKKGIYIYIREMTDQSTPQITKVIKKLKIIYKTQLSQYLEHDRLFDA
jgi:hypothetical protein